MCVNSTKQWILKIYDRKVKKDGMKILINSITAESLKEIKRVKKFAVEHYPDKEIVVKEKTRKGWIEIDI